jgi:hypothetical protein
MSLGNDPSNLPPSDPEVGEAIAAARQERHELARTGPAPSVEAILREMGRGPDGRPIPEGPDEWIPASTAARRALGIDDVEDGEENNDDGERRAADP